ncbi:WD40/YVTN repeat-like-containing domain containing protein [Parasponia andersonii]|uniref:WD40/YVTN repeat-like-containing domain containing protein n=1 Tax=Parasponia andersonii TaxID=3476 RepID=A0A2P5AMI0_PARAD|nr:WD40/YVTN repeat-like-containing domain containing protein [Parasponia andersonii]
MSTMSARRPKDRSGALTGPKTTATGKSFKPVTPISISDKRFSAGKENSSGPISKLQKPTIRPVTRVDKEFVPGATGREGRARWSTTSAPRGRSPSPSEFSRMVSDMRKDRRVSVDRTERGQLNDRALSSSGKDSGGSRVSDSGKKKKGFGDFGLKGSELGACGIRVFRDSVDDGKIAVISEKMSKVCEVLEGNVIESEKNVDRVRIWVNRNGQNDLSSDSINGADGIKNLVSCDSKESGKKAQEKVGIDNLAVKSTKGVDLGKKDAEEKSVKVVEIAKDREVSEEVGGGPGGNNYPSKLHEKLAFLEGKVKRIASDIKRTKEILDMNNPDASKVILTDIQDKISGIEKAMGRVAGDSDAKKSSSKGNEFGDQVAKNGELQLMNDGKSSVKGLNGDELEARLFPHHKLLRSRTTTSKASSGSSQTVESHVGESCCESKVDDKALSPIDENPIAIEFLASLSKEKTKVTMRERHASLECSEVEEMDGVTKAAGGNSSEILIRKDDVELILTTDETLDEFDDQENRQPVIDEETEESCMYQLNEIGCRTSTGGWFVSEGESVLLAHDDGSCTFYDIVNNEEKVVYKPPNGVSPNIWRDCWVIRAPSADGCAGRYVVAASAGNAMDSGFCSWDFYTKDVRACHFESGMIPSRTVLGPLASNISYMRSGLSNLMDPETRQWWYKPCGPLIVVTSSYQRGVKIYDIRDGEEIMKWDVSKPVLAMDYASPLQWRNRGKVVVAEAETISLWDVNSLSPQALLSVPLSGRKISALHVNNTDAELGGGVRQRLSSSEAEGNDGVFCTQDCINILDFRHPTGVGLKIHKLGVNVQSIFSCGDSVFLGCTNVRSGVKVQSSSEVQQFSLRKQKLFSTYALPECNADRHHTMITQVWGNSNNVMAVCGLGLFVFDAQNDNELQPFTTGEGDTQKVREIIGPDDMYSPSFDYSASRALLISRDRPAMWRHLS